MLLSDRHWSTVHRRSFLTGLKRADLLSFVSEFKRMNFIEGYVHGNYTLEVGATDDMSMIELSIDRRLFETYMYYLPRLTGHY